MGVDITPSPRSTDIRAAESPLELSTAVAGLIPLVIPASAAAATPLELSTCAAGLTPLLNYEGASEALAIVHRTTGEKPSKLDKPLTKIQQKLFNEAISFLNILKNKLGSGEVYPEFLKILNEFKEGKHRPFDVSRRVTLLFSYHGHKDLIEEMYKWTPWQHRFYIWPSSGTM
ncbi:hypothetical protein EST38_g2648 [Candolleomyces aberdarensis]|uniref:Uncharacterized protein n=1 Tax=Candolleomyces aberdarensis TaxID=2316362 RepID=A0A4Q2DWA8_9AGAR|nr:hypothetical protein EST38_g2648 [Candolleomyces aberdarensis]